MIVLGLDSRVTTALIIGGGIALFGLLLVITAAGELRGRRKAKVPPSMRPGASDEELERRVLTRYLAWGAAATILMAFWMPLYWLREPTRLETKATQFDDQMIHEGERLYEEFCLRCHGRDGVGTIQSVQVEGNPQDYVEPPLAYMFARYKAAGRSEDAIRQLMLDAINRGRPGTPMPTWGAAFGGPFNTFQVDSVTMYLESIQEAFPEPSTATGEELFVENDCIVCHGVDGSGLDGDGNPTVGPNLQVALQRLSLDEVRHTLLEGRLNTERPSMPAWAALGEDAINELVDFIVSIQRSA